MKSYVLRDELAKPRKGKITKKIDQAIKLLYDKREMHELDLKELISKNPEIVKSNKLLIEACFRYIHTAGLLYNLLGFKTIYQLCTQDFSKELMQSSDFDSSLYVISLSAKGEERKKLASLINKKHYHCYFDIVPSSVQDHLEVVDAITGDWKTSERQPPLIELFKRSTIKEEKEMLARHIFDKIFLPEIYHWSQHKIDDLDLFLDNKRRNKYLTAISDTRFKIENGLLQNGEIYIVLSQVSFMSLSKNSIEIFFRDSKKQTVKEISSSVKTMISSYFKEKNHFAEINSENKTFFINKKDINSFCVFKDYINVNNGVFLDGVNSDTFIKKCLMK